LFVGSLPSHVGPAMTKTDSKLNLMLICQGVGARMSGLGPGDVSDYRTGRHVTAAIHTG
jgi:hypothetical protein